MIPNAGDTISIIELNVNSIISHQRRHNLQAFIVKHKPDIMLLNETKLKDMHVLHFKGYQLIRTNKSSPLMVGTAVLIRDKIKHDTLDTLHWNLQSLECTAVLVTTTRRPLCVISAYRSAQKPNLLTQDIEFLTDICQQKNWDLVLGGDLNAKHTDWQNASTCTQGRALAKWLLLNSIQRSIILEYPSAPSFRRNNYSSVLDLFLISASLNIVRSTNQSGLQVLDYDSDHHAVSLIVNLNARLKRQCPRTVLNFRDVNWSHFKNQLTSTISTVHIPASRNLNPSEIDAKLNEITSCIRRVMSETIPSITIQKDNIAVLPQDILDLIAQKKCMRRRWERARHSPDANRLRTEVKLLAKIIDERIKLFRNAQWTNTLSMIKPGPETFKKVKSLSNPGGMCLNVPKSMLNPDTGSSDSRKEDIAQILGNHFERVHKQNASLSSAAFTNQVNTDTSNRYNNNFSPKCHFSLNESADSTNFNRNRHLISTSSLNSILQTLKNKKSAGCDEIPNVVLRKLPPSCIKKIAILFNQMYNIGYFPNIWKCATVIPICKHNKPENSASSYRPISLLPCLSKVYERALKTVLDMHCEDNNILPDDQFGFRPGRSTNQALVILKTDICTELNRRTPTIACATDIEKAFDTVWREGIVYKMRNKFGFDDHICRCIFHYMLNRTFKVKLDQLFSDTHTIAAGVPQGGVLSALLYIIYVADMPSPPAHTNPIRRLQYADDMIVYVAAKDLIRSEHRLNAYLADIVAFLDKWKIKINPSKCEAIVFKGPYNQCCKSVNARHKHVAIQISGQALTPQNAIKYLGVTLQKNFKHVQHINNILRNVNKCFFGLRPVLQKITGLNVAVKMLCYKQLIRPIITYGFPCWSDISSSQMERLRKVERVCIRACTNTRRRGTYRHINNTRLYRRADIDRIDIALVEQACKFFDKDFPDCNLIQHCRHLDPVDLVQSHTFKPPWYIVHLKNIDMLYENNNLVHYHRRHNTNIRNNLVYNTHQ